MSDPNQEPEQNRRRKPFSDDFLVYAAQEEIDVRFGWIMDEINFARTEREVLGMPSALDRVRTYAGHVVTCATAVISAFKERGNRTSGE